MKIKKLLANTFQGEEASAIQSKARVSFLIRFYWISFKTVDQYLQLCVCTSVPQEDLIFQK